MILITPETPRWIRELDRFIHLKSLLFVHGNVLDLVSYPVHATGTERDYWTASHLNQFFQRYLIGLGYEVVGIFDPVDGLEFATPPMQKLYDELRYDKPTEETAEQVRHSTQNPETAQNAPMQRPPQPGALTDPEPVLQDMAKVASNRTVPCAFVFNFASRLLSSPEHLSQREHALFTRALKASLDSREVHRHHENGTGQSWNNVFIFICDKLNDLPVFLYLNNPRARALHLDKPDSLDRARFLKANYSSFFGASADQPPSQELSDNFSSLTEGFSYHEMLSLIGLSRREELPVQQMRQLCERFKYGISESEWDKLSPARLSKAEGFIRSRIKGQEMAVQRVLEIIKRAKLGLAAGTQRRSQRPRGVLFFAGPTGVGKTELAKAMAELLFGQEERLVRFDMSEFASAHADQKLLGAPPGYVGYEAGGKLTNAMKQQPFSVLLFDEIEKAHPSIFDKFLQILDDGRLSDGQGDTVYFSESIIIFTSNLGTVSVDANTGQRQTLVTADMPYGQVKDTILQAIRDHFNYQLGRPEILNRFGENFVVFDFIRPQVAEQILDRLLAQLIASMAEQQKITLRLQKSVRETLIQLAQRHLDHGGRGIRNLVDAALINPLATALFDNNVQAGQQVRVKQVLDHGEEQARRFSVDISS